MARTTVTLDPDVESLLHTVMRERGLSFKEAVNSAIRSGLVARRPPVDTTFPTFDMGEPTVDLSRALRLAADLEDSEIADAMGRGR